MSFSWPWALAALLAVPVLLVAQWWVHRRRRRTAVRVSSVALVRAAMPGRTRWRRRVPVALFCAGLAVAGVGAARPQVSVDVPSSGATLILAVDVSSSMCSTDVDPNRLVAAQEAATAFVEAQAAGTRIGLVAFSSSAALLVEPTADHDELTSAIADLTTSRGTAIGQAILASVDAIAEIDPDVAPTGVDVAATDDGSADDDSDEEYAPEVVVVLTDGSNSEGVDPATAATEAAARGVRVYTIGFGTTQASAMVCSSDQVSAGAATGGGPGGGGGGGGQTIDTAALEDVASTTGAEYFAAQDAEELTDVLLDLPSTVVTQHEDVEITSWFALGGAAAVLAALGLSVWWSTPGLARRSRPGAA